MNTNQTIYLGIDINGKRRPYIYAALDERRKLIALGQGPLEEVLFFAAGKNEAIAAVNSPSALNHGLLEIEKANQADHPLHTNGRKHAMRMAEFELLQQGCRVPQTPASSELCPAWMQRCFSLYTALEQVGFRPFSTEDNPRQWVETSAEAAYFRLSGQQPLDAHRLEGSLQRQAILYDLDLPVTDPMAFF
jgi:hypothetical protein